MHTKPEILENSPQKKLFIKTYGCQMNMYDSEKMQDLMGSQGFTTTDNVEEGDLIIINTCHIREKASEKMYSELGRMRDLKAARKAEGKRTVIAVAGCVAQAEGAEIKARAPYVDVIVGPQSFQRLPQLVTNAESGVKTGVELDFSTNEKFDFLREETEAEALKFFAKDAAIKRSSAFLTIQEGCDKFCTFCVVPYTRGAEVSRPVHEIYREAMRLASEGVKELNLLGQNVNSYHGRAQGGEIWGLGQLMRHIAEIPGIERIRYSTSHPRDVDDALILAHKEIPQIMPFIHLPVQSGSDTILKAMNRKHTSDDYRRTIEKFRNARSDIEFSSDFIVGFPGETDQDHRDTMKLIEDVGYTLSYSFIYSPRPGTPAANIEDTVPLAVKKERLIELQALITKQMFHYLGNKVGTRQKILVNRDAKHPGQMQGFTEYMQPVVIESADNLFHNVVEVDIYDKVDRALKGRLVA